MPHVENWFLRELFSVHACALMSSLSSFRSTLPGTKEVVKYLRNLAGIFKETTEYHHCSCTML